jgi:prevent-host-death family protein
MVTVTAADVEKDFERYRDAALTEPVIVTTPGETAVVIMAASEYERLKQLDRRLMAGPAADMV